MSIIFENRKREKCIYMARSLPWVPEAALSSPGRHSLGPWKKIPLAPRVGF